MKTMVKSLIIASIMILATSLRADSYIYWMVENAGAYSSASYARIAWTLNNGESATYLLNANEGAGTTDHFTKFLYENYANVGSVTLGENYKFFVELYNEGGTALARTEMLAYNDIAGAIGATVYDISDKAVFNIPEPTSGMLALMGFGLLALRRKQRKA